MIAELQHIPEIMNFHMYVTFIIIICAIILLAIEHIDLEISTIIILLSLLIFFYMFPFNDENGKNLLDVKTILSGFANPVLFTILSLLIIGQGLFHTGALERPAQFIANLTQHGMTIAFCGFLLTAGFISAFLNNTPVVVIFIPIATAIAARLETTASKLLMPLSFITILGGMTTLIGSSSNLIVASIAQSNGIPVIGFFDFFIPGLLLALIGASYVIFILPSILHAGNKDKDKHTPRSGRQFIAQIRITSDHNWIGAQSHSGLFPELKDLTVRLIQRNNSIILPPFEDTEIREGDIIIIAATRQRLTEIVKMQQSSFTLLLNEEIQQEVVLNGNKDKKQKQLTMVESVVSPGSRLIGQTIAQAPFFTETDVMFFGLQRQSRMLRRPLHQINLEAGDILLLLGTHQSIRQLRSNRSLITLEWSASELPVTQHAHRARSIFFTTIALAACGILPIAISSLAGAVLMVASGCLNIRQATRAINRRIYLLIGTAFALSEPLSITGGTEFVANTVVDTFSGLGPAVLLSAFFLLTALLTNFLSNHATAALLAPIAVSTANKIGVSPEAFVYGLIFALNCSFATPIAYQTNLIVMGPGRYTFRDYLYAGLPLVFIIWIAYSLFAPYYFNL